MAEDWLPHEPPTPTPATNNTGKTIVIWAILTVMFVAIFAMSGDNSEPPGVERAGYSGWWIAVAAVTTAAVAVLLLVWVFGSAKRFNTDASPGLEAIADGKYTQAAELFTQLARRYATKPNFAAVASYNRGYALMRGGDTAAAIGILLGVERTPKLGAGGVRRLAATQLGRCFALAGDVEKARRWLDSTRSRGPGMADPIHDRAILDALEGLVLCREGKLDEARAHYELCWSRLAAYLPINQMTEVWLLRAYAISASSTPRDAGGAEPSLRMLRGTPVGGLDWITARWPELQTFAVTHGLAAQQAA